MSKESNNLPLGIFLISLFLVYTPDFPDPSVAVKWLVVGFGGAACILTLRKQIHSISIAHIPLLLWVVLIWVLAFGSVNTSESFAVAAKWSACVFAAIALSFYWKKEIINQRSIARWLGFALFAVWLSALYGILVNASNFSENLYRIQGLGGHKNQLSMMLLVATLVYAYNARHQKSLKLVYVLLSLSSLLMVIVLRTRSLWIALAVISLVVSLELYRRNRQKIKPLRLIIPVAAIALILGSLVFSNYNQAGDTTNLSHRVAFWEKSKQMIADYPQGVGPGMWKLHMPAYGLQGVNHSVEQGQTQILRPHNDYLWILSETGWLGALLWLATLTFIVLGLIKRRKDCMDDAESDFHLLVISVLLGYAIFMFFDFPIERPEQFFLLLWFGGYALTGNFLVWRSNTLVPIFAVCLLATGWVGTFRFQGDQKLNEVISNHSKRNSSALILAVQKCENRFYSLDRVANPLAYYSGLAYLAEKKVVESHDAFSRALQQAPFNIITLNQMGNWHKMVGRNLPPAEQAKLRQRIDGLSSDLVQQSTEYYRRALDISPHFTEALLNMAEFEFLNSNPHQALGYLSQVYPPDYASAKFQKLTAEVLKQWFSLPANQRKRPALQEWFRQNDPSLQNPVNTYIRFLQT